jgi:crotonobetainyl-CoA:carnitine CoA-transferase CaiB-like acyl-CoA transferase
MPPRLGDHTDEVLRELLGIEEAHLQALALKSVTKRKRS